MPINLKQLWFDFPFPFCGDLTDEPIKGIAADNRLVQPGFIFVAMQGYTVDSHQFIPDAIQRGAAVVVGTEEITGLSVPYVKVENSRQALAYLAAAFYGNPGRHLTMIGVTGTDGKTTTVNLIFEILKAAGIKAGMISTVNAVVGDQVLDTGFHVTTPDALEIQRYLAQMVSAGLTHCVLETTSHGWVQHRTDACEFDIGVITNITHEHLNQHGSYENYRAAKARLFQSLAETRSKENGNVRIAILNRDDNSFNYLNEVIKSLSGVRLMSYSQEIQADFSASRVSHSLHGLQFEVAFRQEHFHIDCNLMGQFNVANCLAALTTTVGALKVDPGAASQGIAHFGGVPGRMESIDMGQAFIAIVDFAHTPNALQRALEAARQMTKGRVITVFGSAGLRDEQKRRLMAEVSALIADITIITAEDPRTESLEAILADMLQAARKAGAQDGVNLYIIPDRGNAIRRAVALARGGDIIMLCGKGHEQSMCFGTVEYPWDDRVALRSALAELLHIPGPQMPSLPTSA